MKEDTRERRRAILEEALAVIERDHPKRLKVDDVARAVATSRRQLQRVFDDLMPCSFGEYLMKVRLNRARRLIVENPNMTIKEVAETVGYGQVGYFSKIYVRRFGERPLEIRGGRRAARKARADGEPAEASAAASNGHGSARSQIDQMTLRAPHSESGRR